MFYHDTESGLHINCKFKMVWYWYRCGEIWYIRPVLFPTSRFHQKGMIESWPNKRSRQFSFTDETGFSVEGADMGRGSWSGDDEGVLRVSRGVLIGVYRLGRDRVEVWVKHWELLVLRASKSLLLCSHLLLMVLLNLTWSSWSNHEQIFRGQPPKLRWTQVIVGSVGKGREGQLKDDSGDLCRWAKGLSPLFSSTTNSTCSTTSQSRHIDDLHIFDEETCWRRRLDCNATDLEQKLPSGTHCSARAFSSHRSFHLIFQHELSTFPRNFYCLTHIFFKCLYKQCTIAPNRCGQKLYTV